MYTADSITDDILNVRLQTLGVTEHSFDLDIGGVRFNWLLYDVGGAVRVSGLFLSSCMGCLTLEPRYSEDRQVTIQFPRTPRPPHAHILSSASFCYAVRSIRSDPLGCLTLKMVSSTFALHAPHTLAPPISKFARSCDYRIASYPLTPTLISSLRVPGTHFVTRNASRDTVHAC